jgi:small subunit ribosomal protein S6
LRNYEFVYIISPEVEEEDLERVTEKVSQMIADAGGQVLRLDPMGRRRLAYPIRKFREGHYVLAQIELEPGAISEFKARLGLTEEVIRHLLVRAEEVEGARVEAVPSEEPLPERAEIEPQGEPVEERGEVEPGEEPTPEEDVEGSEQEELGG